MKFEFIGCDSREKVMNDNCQWKFFYQFTGNEKPSKSSCVYWIFYLQNMPQFHNICTVFHKKNVAVSLCQ